MSGFVEFYSAITAEEVKKNASDNHRSVWPSWFPVGTKSTNLVEEVEFLLPNKFGQIPFSVNREEVENDSAHQRPGGHLGFPNGPKNINLMEDVETVLPISSFIEFRSMVSEEKSKMCQPIRGRGGYLVFLIISKKKKHSLGLGRGR